MFTSTMRHWMVAMGLVAVVGFTAASATGVVGGANRAAPAPTVVSGDLGEVVVHAPADLGEVVVHAPHDLGNVLVSVRRLPVDAPYLAEVVVTAQRDGSAAFGRATDTVAALAAVR